MSVLLNTLIRKGKDPESDPDSYLWLMDLDSGAWFVRSKNMRIRTPTLGFTMQTMCKKCFFQLGQVKKTEQTRILQKKINNNLSLTFSSYQYFRN